MEISPEDGSACSLEDGDAVRILSKFGSIEREVKINRGLSPGLIFVPTAFHNNDAMDLVELTQLGGTSSPGLKACRVKIEKQ